MDFSEMISNAGKAVGEGVGKAAEAAGQGVRQAAGVIADHAAVAAPINPAVTAAALIIDQVNERARQIGQGVREPEHCEPAELIPRFNKLRDAAREAMRKDDEEASSFWTEVGAALVQRGSYLENKHKFQNTAEGLKASVETRLAKFETLVVRARDKGEAGLSQLRPSTEEWQQHARQIRDIKDKIDQLHTIEGWEGPAAREYAQACVVQGNATSELAGMAQSTCAALAMLTRLNEALVRLMVIIMMKTTTDIEGLPGGGHNEFYKRTANLIKILPVAREDVRDATRGGPVAAFAAQVEAQVEKTWDAPNLLTTPGKWPSGTSLADRAPGQTNQVKAPDGPVEATPQCHPKPAEQSGTTRW